ncbi:MAG: aminotransferase class I/II-fold pyridoxal phosphate-dependent enzyme, partial [Deltaproteobacteria bacterium]|nr:aminotransferase class I/II-fold pyridoxal phosphate-dependent enzyme [Deltaproteobacteria bacterium]
PHLSQSIILGSLNSENYEKEKEEKFAIMHKRASRVKETLASKKYSEAWDVYPFNSGYFMCLRLKKVNAEKLRLHLLNKYGVGVISLGETDIRIAFSCVEEGDIQNIFDIIFQAIKDIESVS